MPEQMLTANEMRRSRDYALKQESAAIRDRDTATRHVRELVAAADDYFGGNGDKLGWPVTAAKQWLKAAPEAAEPGTLLDEEETHS